MQDMVTRPAAVEEVLDAWGLVDPLRYAVQLLLDFGRMPNPSLAIDGAMMLIGAAREHDKANRGCRDSELQASEVAVAFGLCPYLRAALVDLRWAGLSGSAVERNGHLDHALEVLAEAADTRRSAAA
jgi:hypothetical protein